MLHLGRVVRLVLEATLDHIEWWAGLGRRLGC